MCLEFGVVAGLLAKCNAPTLSSKMVVHPTLRSGKIKLQMYRKKIASLNPSAIATYSASVEDNVTLFCVLEKNDTQAPAHITTPPETDILSVVLLAKSECTNTSKPTPLVVPR